MHDWIKLGKIYHADYIDDHLSSHASNPLAVQIKDDIYRVFFSGRDMQNRSSVGWVDIDIVKLVILKKCQEAAFRYSSRIDDFYSHGVSIGNLYEVNNHKYILFMGWQVRENEHWRGDVGQLSLSSNLENLKLTDNNPFMKVDEEDLVSLSYPWVMKDEGIYKMWYGSTISWDSPNEEMIHVIKHATSKDGIIWQKKGEAIPWSLNSAQAFSRPTVIKNSDGYHMWFSYRSGGGDKYKIGYAHSLDSVMWDTNLHDGLSTSDTGWDSEMVCYPYVFSHKNQIYMLYNGNEYGRYGFGLAVLRES